MSNGGGQHGLCVSISTALMLALLLVAALSFATAARADDSDTQTIYRVKGRDGRETYTNVIEQVPVEQREVSRVDLSHVTLNTAVGSEINRQLMERHEALAQSSYCQELKDAVGRGLVGRAWDEHAMTVTAGAVALLLLIVLPGSVRRAGASMPWRFLSVVVPLGFLIALGVRGASGAQKGFAALQTKAKPCLQETFSQLDQANNPLAAKVSLVDQLEGDVMRAAGLGVGRSAAP